MEVKRQRQTFDYRHKVYVNLANIHEGDYVKIVGGAEACNYVGQRFRVMSEAYQICGTWCVYLEGKGAWDIARLEKVD